MNDRTPNPYVQNGKVTDKGLKRLEATKTVRVPLPGLRGKMGQTRTLTRAEFWNEYLERLKASRA